jgi:hypothetical protein
MMQAAEHSLGYGAAFQDRPVETAGDELLATANNFIVASAAFDASIVDRVEITP